MAYRVYVETAAALGIVLGVGAAFYPTLWLGRRARAILLAMSLGAIALSPLLIAGRGRFPRLAVMLLAVTVGVRLYDTHAGTWAATRPKFLTYVACLVNPFALAMRQVLAERKPERKQDALRFAAGLVAGGVMVAIMLHFFLVDWRAYPFTLEHCAKVISLFLMIQFLPNGLAAGYRLAGLPATDFAGNFFLAATPAEFWRRYNRPVSQFFLEYLFKPSGGLRHPIRATAVIFAFSAVLHEYVFDLPAGRILGYQLVFFSLHGVASVATLRARPSGWIRGSCVLLTFAFNLATARIFFASVNAVIPFYVAREGRCAPASLRALALEDQKPGSLAAGKVLGSSAGMVADAVGEFEGIPVHLVDGLEDLAGVGPGFAGERDPLGRTGIIQYKRALLGRLAISRFVDCGSGDFQDGGMFARTLLMSVLDSFDHLPCSLKQLPIRTAGFAPNGILCAHRNADGKRNENGSDWEKAMHGLVPLARWQSVSQHRRRRNERRLRNGLNVNCGGVIPRTRRHRSKPPDRGLHPRRFG